MCSWWKERLSANVKQTSIEYIKECDSEGPLYPYMPYSAAACTRCVASLRRGKESLWNCSDDTFIKQHLQYGMCVGRTILTQLQLQSCIQAIFPPFVTSMKTRPQSPERKGSTVRRDSFHSQHSTRPPHYNPSRKYDNHRQKIDRVLLWVLCYEHFLLESSLLGSQSIATRL